jgi:hypothetical protein
MKFLPTTSDSNFATMDFFIMCGVVLIPAIAAFLIWAFFFKNRRRRKRRRRHAYPAINPALARNDKSQIARKAEDFSDQPKS